MRTIWVETAIRDPDEEREVGAQPQPCEEGRIDDVLPTWWVWPFAPRFIFDWGLRSRSRTDEAGDTGTDGTCWNPSVESWTPSESEGASLAKVRKAARSGANKAAKRAARKAADGVEDAGKADEDDVEIITTGTANSPSRILPCPSRRTASPKGPKMCTRL